jgi:hypothetical protein
MARSKRSSRSNRLARSGGGSLPIVVAAAFFVLAGASVAFADHLESNDSFCASCHSQPESMYFMRSIASQPVDLASNHHAQATRCIDCHSGRGITGRIGAMSVGAGDLLAWVTHRAIQPAPLTVPIGDANCLKCHGDVTSTRDFRRHFHAFLPRWQAIDRNAATCVDCHTAHTTDGDPNLGFLQQQHVSQVCDACHRVAA